MKIFKNISIPSFFVLILAAIIIFFMYHNFFGQIQESFVTVDAAATDAFKINSNDEFLNIASKIQNKMVATFGDNVDIDDLSLNTSEYFARIENEDLYDYSLNEHYTWSDSTIALYKLFLQEQGFDMSDEDFIAYVDKLKVVYNDRMIIELMANETNRGKFLKSGLLVDASDNIIKPWSDDSVSSLTNDNYIVKCSAGKVQKFMQVGGTGVDISFNSLNNVSFDGSYCNPCSDDELLLFKADGTPNLDRYQCKYNLQFKGSNSDSIWNNIWNNFGTTPVTTSVATTAATDTSATV